MNIVGPPLGKVSIVPDTFPEWNMNQAVCVFRPFRGYDNRFLCYCLLSEVVQSWYARRSKATVGQSNLTLEICRDTPLPIPPTEEQAEILRSIGLSESAYRTWSTRIGAIESDSATLRQSILHAGFSGRLVPQDPDDERASVLLERMAAQRAAAEKSAPTRGHAKRPHKK